MQVVLAPWIQPQPCGCGLHVVGGLLAFFYMIAMCLSYAAIAWIHNYRVLFSGLHLLEPVLRDEPGQLHKEMTCPR